MPDQFKIGDTVKLKSGGPTMTIDSNTQAFAGVDKVYCTWFDASKKHNKQSFSVAALEAVDVNREPTI